MSLSPGRKTMSSIALDELRKRDDLESLRKFLISEQCFPALKDPETAAITMEDLKKLARAWKLNERRNFWKNHSERSDMVSALLQHAEQNQKFLSKSLPREAELVAAPPTDIRPSLGVRTGSLSKKLRDYCGIKYFNREQDSKELAITSRFFGFPDHESHVNKQVDSWRTEDFLLKDNSQAGDASGSGGITHSTGNTIIANQGGSNAGSKHVVSGIKNKVKMVKQRNLATHLMNYSASNDVNLSTLTLKDVQTFVNVADIDDQKTVSNCMIGISNIASSSHVRTILFEINALHKITNMLQYIRGKSALRAAGLLFYYFSCDDDSEDRVYNACSTFLQANGSSKEAETRLLSLYTLNNLMPCIDRQRVAEITLTIVHAHFDPAVTVFDKQLMRTYLSIMLNMCCFTNAHPTLLAMDIMNLLGMIAAFCAEHKNEEIAVLVIKVLHSFLQAPDQAANLINLDYVKVLMTLLVLESDNVLVQLMRVATVLSTMAPLRQMLHSSGLARSVSMMMMNRKTLSNGLSKEAAKFFCNMTVVTLNIPAIAAASTALNNQSGAPSGATSAAAKTTGATTSAGGSGNNNASNSATGNNAAAAVPAAAISGGTASAVAATSAKLRIEDPSAKQNLEVLRSTMRKEMEGLVTDMQAEAVLTLLNNQNISQPVKNICCRALQNLLAVPHNCLKLALSCFTPLTKLLQHNPDHAAATCLLNISCVPQCRSELVENQIHLKLLDFMVANKELNMKSVFLQSIVQMSSSNVCVLELLKAGLIAKLEKQLRDKATWSIWNDISLVLLAVVAFAADNLELEEQINIVRILQIICGEGTATADVVENCANVLKYVSVRYADCKELDTVVKAILKSSDSDEVIESLSHVLYNMTCSADNVAQMLQDSEYVNIMIRILRNGKLEVQENIAQAMRNLCSNPTCTEIMIKDDILSDLIVIALLRTSSEEIKVVCSEAFYNMLCHEKTRLHLLRGDLWWAVMRLCRADSHVVRSNCARALFDLSTDVANIAPLRSHHVLSFVKDIISSGNEQFLNVCLKSAHNLMRQFISSDGDTNYDAHEIVAAIRLAMEMLPRMQLLDSVRHCIGMLLECAQQNHLEESAAEFVNQYVVEVLDNTKGRWGRDADCRLYISRIFWELSKSDVFTKSNTLSDLDPVLCAAYQGSPPFEICENIAAITLQIILREKVPGDVLISLPIWKILLREGLSTESSVLPGTGKRSSVSSSGGGSSSPAPPSGPSAGAGGGLASTRSTVVSTSGMRSDVESAVQLKTFSTKSIVLSLLAYSIHDTVKSKPDSISKSLVLGMCSTDLIDDAGSRGNLLIVVDALSEYSNFAGFLLDAKIFKLLHRHLTNMVGTSKLEHAQEFCATILHNFSLHGNLVARFVSAADGHLCALIRELLEVPNSVVNLLLSVFFFNSAGLLVKNEQSLNPKFVLETIGKINNMSSDKESDLSNINKYTISMLLNKYKFGAGVDPAYVQYMLSYMQQSQSTSTPEYMETVTFRHVDFLKPKMESDTLQYKFSESVDLETFDADDTLWHPTASSETKRHENIILKFSQAMAITNDSFEASDYSTVFTFNKIKQEFRAVQERIDGGDSSAIAEGDEDDEEGDDDEEEDENDEDDGNVQEDGETDPTAPAVPTDDVAAATATTMQQSGGGGTTINETVPDTNNAVVTDNTSNQATDTDADDIDTGEVSSSVPAVLRGRSAGSNRGADRSRSSRDNSSSPQPPSSRKRGTSSRSTSPSPRPDGRDNRSEDGSVSSRSSARNKVSGRSAAGGDSGRSAHNLASRKKSPVPPMPTAAAIAATTAGADVGAGASGNAHSSGSRSGAASRESSSRASRHAYPLASSPVLDVADGDDVAAVTADEGEGEDSNLGYSDNFEN